MKLKNIEADEIFNKLSKSANLNELNDGQNKPVESEQKLANSFSYAPKKTYVKKKLSWKKNNKQNIKKVNDNVDKEELISFVNNDVNKDKVDFNNITFEQEKELIKHIFQLKQKDEQEKIKKLKAEGEQFEERKSKFTLEQQIQMVQDFAYQNRKEEDKPLHGKMEIPETQQDEAEEGFLNSLYNVFRRIKFCCGCSKEDVERQRDQENSQEYRF